MTISSFQGLRKEKPGLILAGRIWLTSDRTASGVTCWAGSILSVNPKGAAYHTLIIAYIKPPLFPNLLFSSLCFASHSYQDSRLTIYVSIWGIRDNVLGFLSATL